MNLPDSVNVADTAGGSEGSGGAGDGGASSAVFEVLAAARAKYSVK